MSLRWGHIPGLHGATAGQRVVLVLALVIAMLAGGIVPRPLPINTITPQARAEIDEVLSLLQFGLERRDRFWIEFVIDQERPVVAACLRALFQASDGRAQLEPLRLVHLEPVLDVYARGAVQERDGTRTYHFRRVPRTRVISAVISQTTWRWHISTPPVPAPINGAPLRCP